MFLLLFFPIRILQLSKCYIQLLFVILLISLCSAHFVFLLNVMELGIYQFWIFNSRKWVNWKKHWFYGFRLQETHFSRRENHFSATSDPCFLAKDRWFIANRPYVSWYIFFGILHISPKLERIHSRGECSPLDEKKTRDCWHLNGTSYWHRLIEWKLKNRKKNTENDEWIVFFSSLFFFQRNSSNPCQARLNVCNKVRVNFKGPECLATHVEWKSNEKNTEKKK